LFAPEPAPPPVFAVPGIPFPLDSDPPPSEAVPLTAPPV